MKDDPRHALTIGAIGALKENRVAQTLVERFALLVLSEVDDPPSTTKLSRMIGMSQSTGTYVVKRLAADGYVTHQQRLDDKREWIVKLTDKGRLAVKDAERKAAL